MLRRLPGGLAACFKLSTHEADNSYASGTLFETTGQAGPPHTEIASSRAEPASGGDDKYFVSNLFPGQSSLSNTGRTISMSNQTTDLYLVIYTSASTSVPGADAHIEHFVLRFR